MPIGSMPGTSERSASGSHDYWLLQACKQLNVKLRSLSLWTGSSTSGPRGQDLGQGQGESGRHAVRGTGGQQGMLQGTQDGRELEPQTSYPSDSAVQQMAVTGYDSRTGPRSSGPWAGPLWGQDGPWARTAGSEWSWERWFMGGCGGGGAILLWTCSCPQPCLPPGEWPCLPKAARLSLIPSSAHLQLSPQRPGAQLRSCRCQLAGSLQGPPRSRPQGVNSNRFRITLSPHATCHLPPWPHCPRHSTPHAALWQVRRRLAEEALPQAPKPDMGPPPCLLPCAARAPLQLWACSAVGVGRISVLQLLDELLGGDEGPVGGQEGLTVQHQVWREGRVVTRWLQCAPTWWTPSSDPPTQRPLVMGTERITQPQQQASGAKSEVMPSGGWAQGQTLGTSIQES